MAQLLSSKASINPEVNVICLLSITMHNIMVRYVSRRKRGQGIVVRTAIAVLAGRIAGMVSRVGGFKGSSMPGRVSRMIDPGILRKLAGRVVKNTIMICGTNGKTTTAGMIAYALQQQGCTVIANKEGANMLNGVTAAFVKSAGLLGNNRSSYAVIEADEASVPAIAAEIKPGIVVVTNFSHDQMDRYGDPASIIDIVTDGINKLGENTVLILNGDDPGVAQLSKKTVFPTHYYGITDTQLVDDSPTGRQVVGFCPLCGQVLEDRSHHYGQLGDYKCGCGFARPVPRIEAVDVTPAGGTYHYRTIVDQKEGQLKLNAIGMYNIYNTLAATSACAHLGFDLDGILFHIGGYKPITGRMEHYRIKDKEVYLNLVKNPAGFGEALSYISKAPGTFDLFIGVNDKEADGEDISWLWDVDFEVLTKRLEDLQQVVCSGLRGNELAVRLKYAGVPIEKIRVEDELKQAVSSTLESKGNAAYLLLNYTLLEQTHRIVDGKA
jgi:UDP-N-acetylmuramyl tripeptide synthase